MKEHEQLTAYCICSVISPISKPNRLSSSLRLFCHVPLKRDKCDWDWRLRLNDTSDAIVCMGWLPLVGSIKSRSLLQNIVSFIGLFCQRDQCDWDWGLRSNDPPDAIGCIIGWISKTFCQWLSYRVAKTHIKSYRARAVDSLLHVEHCNTARSFEDETRNGHRNAKRNPNRNHETSLLGLFAFENLKRDTNW